MQSIEAGLGIWTRGSRIVGSANRSTKLGWPPVINFYGRNLDFPQITETGKSWFRCLNLHKSVKTMRLFSSVKNYTQKLIIPFKMANSCCFSLRGTSSKKLYNIDNRYLFCNI